MLDERSEVATKSNDDNSEKSETQNEMALIPKMFFLLQQAIKIAPIIGIKTIMDGIDKRSISTHSYKNTNQSKQNTKSYPKYMNPKKFRMIALNTSSKIQDSFDRANID